MSVQFLHTYFQNQKKFCLTKCRFICALDLYASHHFLFIEEMFFDQKFGKFEVNIIFFSLLNTMGTLIIYFVIFKGELNCATFPNQYF